MSSVLAPRRSRHPPGPHLVRRLSAFGPSAAAARYALTRTSGARRTHARAPALSGRSRALRSPRGSKPRGSFRSCRLRTLPTTLAAHAVPRYRIVPSAVISSPPNCLAPDPSVALCALAAFERDAPVRALGVRARQPTGEPLAGAHKSAIPPVTISVFEMLVSFSLFVAKAPLGCVWRERLLRLHQPLDCVVVCTSLHPCRSDDLPRRFAVSDHFDPHRFRSPLDPLSPWLLDASVAPDSLYRYSVDAQPSGDFRRGPHRPDGPPCPSTFRSGLPFDLHFRRFVSQRRSGSGSQLPQAACGNVPARGGGLRGLARGPGSGLPLGLGSGTRFERLA